jgi:hypothetical protein
MLNEQTDCPKPVASFSMAGEAWSRRRVVFCMIVDGSLDVCQDRDVWGRCHIGSRSIFARSYCRPVELSRIGFYEPDCNCNRY